MPEYDFEPGFDEDFAMEMEEWMDFERRRRRERSGTRRRRDNRRRNIDRRAEEYDRLFGGLGDGGYITMDDEFDMPPMGRSATSSRRRKGFAYK